MRIRFNCVGYTDRRTEDLQRRALDLEAKRELARRPASRQHNIIEFPRIPLLFRRQAQ